MHGSRFAVFLIAVLSVWTAMHAYVFWRLATVPWVAAHLSRRTLILVAASLWASYPLGRILSSWHVNVVAHPLEYAGASWIGVLFLLLSALVAVEVVTAGGWLLPRLAPVLREWAALTAGALSVIGLAQGFRPPVVRDCTVHLPGLPAERDHLSLVAISDLHLGTMIGQRYLTRLIDRIAALQPDLVVMVGDLVDGEADRVERLRPILQTLRAPLGVYAVTGNHEYYAGLDQSVALLESAGFRVLRDRWAEVAPGLVLAGVDDLTARRQFGDTGHPVPATLSNLPSGAVIFLSHTPWQAEGAAAAGAGLMLSGHTHGGQIWPFNFLVKLRYPLLAGRYQVDGMTVIVGRGTGTWGPRLRLWRPSELLRITLRPG